MVESLNQAAQIARDAKTLLQNLRDSLKTRDPWDREIEFQRQNLRRQYLQLLLAYPYAPQSQSADNPLWIETSHAFINVYRQRITALDKAMTNSPPPTEQSKSKTTHGPVEFRRLVQRFRQFLAEEEKFWTAFIIRFVRSFALDESKPALVALGIVPLDSQNGDQTVTRPRNDHARNQFPEEGNPTPPPAGQREKKLLILTKAFVSLGDLARYREQYNEAGGRPRAGKETHDESPRKNGRGGGRKAGDTAPTRPRNYSKASDCYQQARLLFPEAGNASHQLAILASYTGDSFSSVLHYYRSLCVRTPFPTATENLDKTLARALDGHRTLKLKAGEPGMQSPQSPRGRVEKCKREVILLHALWRLDPEERDELVPSQAASVIDRFRTLVIERIMPAEIISKIIVLAISALWNTRQVREPNSRRASGSSPSEHRKLSTAAEALILTHILDLVKTLAQIGIEQQSVEVDPTATDLSQNITAVFRRTLPSLRIATKWLRSNLDYVTRAAPSATATSSLVQSIVEFWKTYADFATIILRSFPLEGLPMMTAPLEEDVEMSGFSPLKKTMFEHSTKTPNGLLPGQSQVHPNEEQLMRISDLLCDAKFIAELETSPLRLEDGTFTAHLVQLISFPPTILSRPQDMAPSHSVISPYVNHAGLRDIYDDQDDLEDDIDDGATVSTRTEDDPVNLAMRATLDHDSEDDEEEQILYPQHTPQKPIATASPSQVIRAPHQQHAPSGSTTAQDLLLRVLGNPPSPHRAVREPSRSSFGQSSAPQPHLLFGTGSTSSPSIWSPSRESFSSLDSRTYLQGQQLSPTVSSPPAWGGNFSPTHSQPMVTTPNPHIGNYPHSVVGSHITTAGIPQTMGTGAAFAVAQFPSSNPTQPYLDPRQQDTVDRRVRQDLGNFSTHGQMLARPWA